MLLRMMEEGCRDMPFSGFNECLADRRDKLTDQSTYMIDVHRKSAKL